MVYQRDCAIAVPMKPTRSRLRKRPWILFVVTAPAADRLYEAKCYYLHEATLLSSIVERVNRTTELDDFHDVDCNVLLFVDERFKLEVPTAKQLTPEDLDLRTR